MTTICDHRIEDASAWLGGALDPTDYLVLLDDQDRAEVRAALAHVKSAGFNHGEFGWGDFPLERFRSKIDQVRAKVQWGTGVAMLRGLNVDDYGEDDLTLIYWGIGVHLGLPVGQNRKGERMGRVEAILEAGQPIGDRGYNRPGSLPFHADFSDTVGLLCVRKAQSGGTSLIVSATTLHNQILEKRPDLLPALYEGMYTNLRNEGPHRTPNERSTVPIQAFEYFNGRVSCFFSIDRYKGGQDAVGGAPLSATQLEALEYMNELAQDAGLNHRMDFEPGDIQFLNNYTVLHARTNYQDFPEPERRRLLLRIWIRFPEEHYRLSPARARMFRWGMDQVLPAMA